MWEKSHVTLNKSKSTSTEERPRRFPIGFGKLAGDSILCCPKNFTARQAQKTTHPEVKNQHHLKQTSTQPPNLVGFPEHSCDFFWGEGCIGVFLPVAKTGTLTKTSATQTQPNHSGYGRVLLSFGGFLIGGHLFRRRPQSQLFNYGPSCLRHFLKRLWVRNKVLIRPKIKGSQYG